MTVDPWPCSKCNAPGVLNLGTEGWCSSHLSELLRSFDRSAFGLRGRWIEVGCVRPDHGPGYAECECPACGASAVALVGSPCGYCELAVARLANWQAGRVLSPPDERTDASLRAWAQRMATAVRAGVVARDEARRAWHREVGRDAAA